MAIQISCLPQASCIAASSDLTRFRSRDAWIWIANTVTQCCYFGAIDEEVVANFEVTRISRLSQASRIAAAVKP
jgi:hypothetical protein